MRSSYSRLTRSISWLLIFAMLAMQTVSVPMISSTRASSLDHANLVSIIVDEETYSGETADLIDRYAEDIQATQDNTRVAIFTVPADIHPDRIAALNEKLYYEGDGSGLSNLIGTILVGSIPLPVVHAEGQAFLSIYPYVDFEQKNFLYEEASGKFQKVEHEPLDPAPEIWHSVIMPDTGSEASDRADLKAFFDKTHAFHTASDQFQPSQSQNPPYVFFFDGYHDQLATSLVNWKSYQRYMEHQEDFAYARYNKHLAEELVGEMQDDMEAELGEAGRSMLASLGQSSALASMNFALIPDIQSKQIIEKAVNPFYKILNEKYVGDLLRYAYDSGRYGDANDVRTDIASVMVAKKDELVRETLKSANDLFEDMIDEIVENDVATKAKILDRVTYVISEESGDAEWGGGGGEGAGGDDPSASTTVISYKNYFYGTAASDVTDPRQCSITRGSSLMIEANKGYNVMRTEEDASFLAEDLTMGRCFPGGSAATMSLWGGNSPLNLDTNSENIGASSYRLKSQRYKAFFSPIYDLGGAREIPFAPSWTEIPTLAAGAAAGDIETPPSDPGAFGENMALRVASPMDCFDDSLILQPYTYTETTGGGENSTTTTSYYPSETQAQKLSCITDIRAVLAPPSPSSFGSCTTSEEIVDGPAFSASGAVAAPCAWGGEGAGGQISVHAVYEYKTIPSIIQHKSPDEDDLVAASRGVATPSLAIDKDRYTDFLDANGTYARVDYPNLFRIDIETLDDLNPEYARSRIQAVLDAASVQVNALAYRNAPAAPIDFYARLAAKPEALNAVVESVLWANLDNATAKYRFILENALDSTSPERTPVADHKSDYEIAYLSSLGEPGNMYVKIDPEKNTVTPQIATIQETALAYRSLRDASNLPGVEGGASFKCGPPDGVMIWAWLPAIFCWIGSLLPPTIEAGSCSDSSLLDLANAVTTAPQGDADGNGVLDAIESVRYGDILLETPTATYTYGAQVPMSATIMRDGYRLWYDSTSVVRFDVAKIVAYPDGAATTIYDSADPTRSDSSVIDRYLNFRASNVPADKGLAKFAFSTGNQDADVTILASVTGGGFVANTDTYTVVSNPIAIKIRSERLDVTSRIRADSDSDFDVGSSLAAGNPYGLNFTIERRNRREESLPFAGSLVYRVYDENDMLVSGDTARPVAGNTLNFSDAAVLRKAGTYRFEFVDSDGLSSSHEITILPAPVSSIDVRLSTSVFVRGQPVQALVRPLDTYGNPVMGDLVTIDATVESGDALFADIAAGGSETLSGSLSIDTVEGYYAFEIRSDSTGRSLLKFRDPDANIETGLIEIHAIEAARLQIDVTDADAIVVGKEPHDVNLRVVWNDGNPIVGYNGIVALDFPSVSGVFSPAFVQIVDGTNRNPVIFTPAYVAGESISVTATLPGVADTGAPSLTVRPDVPMETSLSFDRTSVEADSVDALTATATLYDRYGNIATGHPNPMTARFDIDTEYRKFARFDGNGFSASATFSRGVANVAVHPTKLPGAAYIRVTADPSISGNSFTVTDTTGTELTAHGVSENVARFDSFYFYNREKLELGRYNALYTVLGGAAYADVTHGNSLGNAIIFRPESRSLAVTGLVNSPFSNDWLFSLTPAGQYRERTGDASIGLETTVSLRDEHIGLTWYDSTIREHIADADIAPADADTALVACTGTDVSACSVPESGRYALLAPANTSLSASESDGTLSLFAGSRRLVSIDSSLRTNLDPTVTLVPDTVSESNLLWFTIDSNNQTVGRLGLSLSGVALGDDETGDIRITPVSNRYGTERTYLGNSSNAERGVRFFRVDTTRDQIDAVRSGPFPSGLEYATKQAGIGWEGDNTFLLEFSAGASVGEATRLHATYSTLNLGDPYARLPYIAPTNGSSFDQTIGTRLLDTGESVESVEKIDFNHDATDDLVVFLGNGRVRLFANYSGNLKDMGYLAAVSDAGKKRKGVGDFSGDNYPDIAGVTDRGKLFILENIEGRFERADPEIFDLASGEVAEIRGAITSLHTFDMDRDGRDDLVTVDDSGELCILYGREDGAFDKLIVSRDFAVKLTGQVLSSGGAVYYDWLHQLPSSYDPEILRNEAEEVGDYAENADGAFTGAVLRSLIDQEIFYQDEWYETDEPEREPSLSDWISAAGTDDSGNPNESIGAETLAAMRAIEDRGGTTDFVVSPTRTESRTYIRSTYSEWAGIRVEKRVTDVDGEALRTGDTVAVELAITNIGPTAKNAIEYLDSIDRSVLKTGADLGYTIGWADGSVESGTMEELVRGSFDLAFDLGRLAAWETATIRYNLVARMIGYAEVVVGDIEPETPYGEIVTRANNLCGSDYSIWRPIEPYPRTYQAGTLSLDGVEQLPDAVGENFGDSDGDGTPDIIEMVSDPSGNASQLQDYAQDKFSDYLEEAEDDAREMARSSGLFKNTGGGSFEINALGEGGFDSLNEKIDNIVEGLGCGFGGGSCLSLPLNWAPLAPGTAPSILGFPGGPLIPETGIPIFSGLTGIPSSFGCIPSVWPTSPLGLSPSPSCGAPSAGGFLGTRNPTNYFRLYVTPTLTLGVGVAACFGGPAAAVGRIPPPGVSPAVPGGNCVIAARPLFSCEDDGSEWNAFRGLPTAGYYNANQCRADEDTLSEADRIMLRRDALSYVRWGRASPSSFLSSATGQGSLKKLGSEPMVGIGLGTGAEPNFEVGIDTDAIANFDIGNIVKISNIRIPAFPDFLMEWVTRQTEEIINKLTSLPTLYIILPDLSGLNFESWGSYPSKLQKEYNDAFANDKGVDNLSIGGNNSSVGAVRDASSVANDALNEVQPIADRVSRNISGIKAAYEFMSNLPLIEIEPEQYNVRIPWIAPEDIEKWLGHAQATYIQWKAEIARAKEEWWRMDNGDAILNQVDLKTGPMLSSLERNIKTIEEYKNFPDKLLKYLKYKEIYAEQILCNIEAIEFMLGGWLADNAKRFKTWVELYLLIKTILKSWQVIIDFFVDLDAECGVCRNERYDLKHFLFKILSAVIPSPPIIRFPKWPDIILDLHSIRAGLRIPFPEFDFRVVPLVLPRLPELHLPDVPSGSIGLPALPQLPQIPQLPDLPDLPSLPLIELPDLPPPPKIPKLFGAIAAVLDILRLIGKILCLLRLNPFAPEWRAGDVIAQLTERQGTLPLDFLSLEFPEFSMSFIDAIKVTSKVNLEFEVDFIMAMMTAALEPLNSFTSDLSKATRISFPNVDLRGVVPESIEADVGLDGGVETGGLEDLGGIPSRLDAMAPFIPSDPATGIPLYSTGSVVAWMRVAQIGFPRLLSALDENMREDLSITELRTALNESQKALAKSEHPKFREAAEILREGLERSMNPVDDITAPAQERAKEKFDLVREYVRRYRSMNQRDIAELHEVIRGNKDLIDASFVDGSTAGIIKIAASEDRPYADITDRLNELNSEAAAPLEKILDPSKDPDLVEIDRLGKSARESLSSLALSADAPTERVVETAAALDELDANNLTSNYRYNYDGIYYRTSAGVQTRLFNYTELLTGSERVEEFDPDMDGDADIVYVMDNAVFIKENHIAEPAPRHRSENVRVRDLESFVDSGRDRSTGYRAPDYFLEDFAASGRINASFLAADSGSETRYRLEMYPYIDRFDRIASGEIERSIAPVSIKESIDLVPDLSEVLGNSDITVIGGDIRHAYAVVRSAVGDFTVGGMEYEAIEPGERVTLRVGSRLYARLVDTVVFVRPDDDTTETEYVIPAGESIGFEQTMDIRVAEWQLIAARTKLYSPMTLSGDNLRGMPIVPGMRIEIPSGGRLLIEYFDGARSVFDTPAIYEYQSIGDRDGEYSFALPRENRFSYARLAPFDAGGYGTWANLTLLAPQIAADNEPPVLYVSDTLRIPVYQSREISLRDQISDSSNIAEIFYDFDTTIDTDANGDPTDDRDSLAGDPVFPIRTHTGSNVYDVSLGAFDTLFLRPIRLHAIDAAGNRAFRDVMLEVYAPVPIISGRNASGMVVGGLNESLSGEPVDLVRVRDGYLSRIEPLDGTGSLTNSGTVFTATGGAYAYIPGSGTGAAVWDGDTIIARVDDTTGALRAEPGYRVGIEPKDATNNRMTFTLMPNGSNEILYRQRLELPSGTPLVSVSDFGVVSSDAVYIRVVDPRSRYTHNDAQSPSLPSGAFVVDRDSRAVFGLDATAALVGIRSGVSYEYSELGGYPLVTVVADGVEIAQVWYRLSFDYAVR